VSEIGQRFDKAATGTIRGQVLWQGTLAHVSPLEYRPRLESPVSEREYYPNPHAPMVDPVSLGLGNAVVFLRQVELSHSKPWDHAGVFVVLSGKKLRLEQGTERIGVAFARRGEPLTMKSGDEALYILRGGGASFFSLTFAEPHRPRQRFLEKTGLVELSSAAGHFWQHAYVFVDDHPYYTRTDPQGRFCMDQVPPGEYQVVCWVPNWSVPGHERDPETGVIRTVRFGQPLELAEAVNVLPGTEPTLQFLISSEMFQR
jgi:hypothetical protein